MMNTKMKCFVAALAIGTLTGCETLHEQLREQSQVRGADALTTDAPPRERDGSCAGCRRKWSAKPDGGVNGPPWGY